MPKRIAEFTLPHMVLTCNQGGLKGYNAPTDFRCSQSPAN
ncbi:hypothetical protein ABIE78_001240 [Sinorhizobium fredii]